MMYILFAIIFFMAGYIVAQCIEEWSQRDEMKETVDKWINLTKDEDDRPK